MTREVGFICRMIRERNCLKQEDIAELMNVTQGSVSMFECGRHYSGSLSVWYLAHATDEERKIILEAIINDRKAKI